MQNSSKRRHASAPLVTIESESLRRRSPHLTSSRSTPGYGSSSLRHYQTRESSSDELGEDAEVSSTSDEPEGDDDVDNNNNDNDHPQLQDPKIDPWVYQPGHQLPPILSTSASTISPSYGLERLIRKGRDETGKDVYVIERTLPGAGPISAASQQQGGIKVFTETFAIPIEDATEHVSLAELERFEHNLDKEERLKAAKAIAEPIKSQLTHTLTSTNVDSGVTQKRGRGRPPKVKRGTTHSDGDAAEGLIFDAMPVVVIHRSHSRLLQGTEEGKIMTSDYSSGIVSDGSDAYDLSADETLGRGGQLEFNSADKRDPEADSGDKAVSNKIGPPSKKFKPSPYPAALSSCSEVPAISAPTKTGSHHRAKHPKKRRFEFHSDGVAYPDPVNKGEKREWQIKSIRDDRPAKGKSLSPINFDRDRQPAHDDPLQDEYLVEFHEYSGDEEFWVLEEDLMVSAPGLLSSYCQMREHQWRRGKF